MRDLISELTQIGFTEYDARVYLALLGNHPATGYQVSKVSGVPRSMAYESLARLAGRGAVLKSAGGKATTYRPLPPDVLLARVQEEHAVRVRRLNDGLGRLFAVQTEDALWSIDGRQSILPYAAGMANAAESELMLVLPDRDISDLRQALSEASERGVEVNILMTGSAELRFGNVVYHPPRESELQKLTESLVVIVDEREALIASGTEKLSATVTTNENLVLIARQFVWMELFAQRVYARIGPELIQRLEPADRQVLEIYAKTDGENRT
jgi:sugar-specific transcriptional regulator TrmB